MMLVMFMNNIFVLIIFAQVTNKILEKAIFVRDANSKTFPLQLGVLETYFLFVISKIGI